MAERSYVWNGVLLGDASIAPYSDSEWVNQWALLHGVGSVFPNYGVLKGTGDGTYEPLAVQATAPASSNVEVQIGSALVHGRLYENTAAVTLAVAANASGNPRIDTVILRTDFVAQTVRLVVKQGTPAGSPVAPTLQQDASYWEIPLANIAVANGFGTLAQSVISDRRRSVQASPNGWQAFAYPQYYIPNNAYNASTLASGTDDGIAIPFVLTGNMLIQSVTVRFIGASINYNLSWGLYIQDVNDGNASENTLRLVATGGNSGTTGAGPVNITLPASPLPASISPGAYWLVIKSSGAIGAFNFAGIAPPAGFETGLNLVMSNTVLVNITQTLDFVTNWTPLATTVAARLNGRVFGQTAAF